MINVKVIVESDKGNVLLVKPNYKDTWQMPGGGVEASENPIDAAVRETKEEVNLDIDPTELLLINTVYKKDDDILFLIYEYGTTVDETIEFTVDDEEIEAYKFVAPSEVSKLLPYHYEDFWNNYLSK